MDWSEIERNKAEFDLTPFSYPIVKNLDTFFREQLSDLDVVVLIGCGARETGFKNKTIRVDVDKSVKPDYTDYHKVDDRFDVVVMRNVVEHLTLDEIRVLFNWVHQNKKKLMFNFPNPFSTYGVFASDYTHKTFFNHRCYGGLLREAGFKEVNFYRISGAKLISLRSFVGKNLGLDICQSMAAITK